MPAVKSHRISNWKDILARQLPLLGHRNWIVVADSAYPWQSAPGIETVCTNADHLTVARHVVTAVESASHVRPVFYTDTELAKLNEKDAPGIHTYRNGLHKLMSNDTVHSLPHDQMIAKLDDAGKAFRILLLKTTLTLPYTTIFVQLDCGYWSAEAAGRLRHHQLKVV